MNPGVVHCKRDPYQVYIGRPSIWGNPFQLGRDGDRDQVIARYRDWLGRNRELAALARRVLPDKTLGCWCSPQACHGEVLHELANRPVPPADIDCREPVFVFGSNQAGRHGRGAALFARRHYGAIPGRAEGLQGVSYALPTKDGRLAPLPLSLIREAVERFLGVARRHPDTLFQVTRVGCGLAGQREGNIMPLFRGAPANCLLPGRWECTLGRDQRARVLVSGDPEGVDPGYLDNRLDRLLERLRRPVIITGGGRGVEQQAEDYAIRRGLDLLRIPPDSARYGRDAEEVHRQLLCWHGTEMALIGGTPENMPLLHLARDAGLNVRVLPGADRQREEARQLDLLGSPGAGM